MEPGLSIESGSAIRVIVLPVGGPIPAQCLRDYAALVSHHARVDLASLRPYYKEHQKSPFAHQPWDAGFLRFKFVLGGCVPSPWEDFQSSRKVLAVVGICHLPSSPNLDRVAAEFVDSARSYPSALANRCFAFCPTDAQVRARQLPPRLVQIFQDRQLRTRGSQSHLRDLHFVCRSSGFVSARLLEFGNSMLISPELSCFLRCFEGVLLG
jgi:hypothetical protein